VTSHSRHVTYTSSAGPSRGGGGGSTTTTASSRCGSGGLSSSPHSTQHAQHSQRVTVAPGGEATVERGEEVLEVGVMARQLGRELRRQPVQPPLAE
jgi:hypothetical protein